jgi:hypothetical protein
MSTTINLNKLIVFDHPVCSISYAPDAHCYHIDDSRFLEPRLYDNVREFSAVFIENLAKAVLANTLFISIPYNHLIAKAVELHLQTYHSDGLDHWPVVSFFHDDESTSRLSYPPGADPLDDKVTIIYDMLDFPFIKKIEIPCYSVISAQYLFGFFDS